jgi:GT2 family glycosyltransferase
MPPDPFVSVVVPTSDRCAVVAECLQWLRRQAYPRDRYEVIVVDDGSRDSTPATIGGLAGRGGGPAIRYLRRSRAGAGAARNTGLEHAQGELVCFLDDDALAPEGWLAALVEGARRHPDAGLLGGAVRARFEHRPPHTCEDHDLAGMHLDHGRADTEVDEVWGCNMAVRPSAVAVVGGFDERLGVGEDWDWGRRLLATGGRIVYLPAAWVVHRRLASDLVLSRLLVEYYRRGFLVGTRDSTRAPREALRLGAHSLRHAVGRRCTRGLTDAARGLGLWSGALTRRLAPPAGAGRWRRPPRRDRETPVSAPRA